MLFRLIGILIVFYSFFFSKESLHIQAILKFDTYSTYIAKGHIYMYLSYRFELSWVDVSAPFVDI